jgi:hypothetical protein
MGGDMPWYKNPWLIGGWVVLLLALFFGFKALPAVIAFFAAYFLKPKSTEAKAREERSVVFREVLLEEADRLAEEATEEKPLPEYLTPEAIHAMSDDELEQAFKKHSQSQVKTP